MDIAIDAAPEPYLLRYRVGGMDCPSCAGKIETGLGRLAGVRDVEVDYHGQSLSLVLDEARTTREAVKARVRALGFDIRPVLDAGAARAAAISGAPEDGGPGDEAPAPAWWRTAKARSVMVTGVLLAAGFGVDWAAPSLGGWGTLPAAAAGLWMAAPRALVLAGAGSPFSIEMLMTIASVGALLIGAPAEAATVVFLFAAGEMMEGIAAGRARAGVRALTATVPRTALLVDGDAVRAVPAAAIRIGQTVLVRPGDRVAVDGIVREGLSALDQSPITGESVPVACEPGGRVLAGSINGEGALQVQATSLAADNTIARIVHMVEAAQASRAPTARFIDRFSTLYTPFVVAAAALAILAPPLLFGAAWHTWIYRGLSLLLIGCPCAMVLSTPAAITAGIATGARRGLLIKGGAALEAIGRVRAVAFDKTGTLTEGEPRVTDIAAFVGSERGVLALAASAESGSGHPLARAILRRAEKDGVPLRPARDARAVPGRGATATVAGKPVAVASPRYAAAEFGAIPFDIEQQVSALEEAGKTVVLVLCEGKAVGLLALRDAPRADAAAGLRQLRALGIEPVMLTGDNRRAAAAIGSALDPGLAMQVRSELSPADKLREIGRLKGRGPVAMVGDGINDAPALAAASVGIAMSGTGGASGATDVALETADAAILGGRVADVSALVRLSRATMRNIHQNLAFALGLKVVFLLTTLMGITGLWPAILSDTGATVIVTLNALRLLRHR